MREREETRGCEPLALLAAIHQAMLGVCDQDEGRWNRFFAGPRALIEIVEGVADGVLHELRSAAGGHLTPSNSDPRP